MTMPPLSPMVFSPRPSLVNMTSRLSPSSTIAIADNNEFSYVVSSDGVEIYQPQLKAENDRVAAINTAKKLHSLLPNIDKVIETPEGHKASTTNAPAIIEISCLGPLYQRRGKQIPSLVSERETRKPDGNLSNASSQETLVHSSHLSNDKRSDIYDILEQIGDDSEGPCTLLRRKDDHQLRVVKSVRQPTMAYGKPIEARVLLETFPQRHPNIIQLHSYEFTQQISLVQYYFEYCSGGDLHDLCYNHDLRNVHFPELFIWKVFLQLTEALEFLHRGFDHKVIDRPGIVHRDIKPQNIFVHRSQYSLEYPDVVIADFGTASFDFATYEPAGTFVWQPPEIPRKTPKGDVWSLGAVIHQMIHFTPPMLSLPEDIEPTALNEDLWAINPNARSPILETPEIYSNQLIHMMLIALELDHNKRVSSSRLLTILDAVMEQKAPSNGDKIMNPEPLEAWAFDHMHNGDISPTVTIVEDDGESEGTRQYFDMMDRLWHPTRLNA